MGGTRQKTGEHMAQGKHITSHVLTINRTRTQAYDKPGISELFHPLR